MGVEGHGTGGVQRRTVPIRCVREGGGGGGGGGRGERVGERGRGRERMKAMGRDYMDMPLHGHALTIHLAMVGWVTSPFFSF